MGRLAEAAEETRKAVALDPRRAGARANLAAALVALGMTEEGIREYERALALDPRNGRAAAGRRRMASGRVPPGVPPPGRSFFSRSRTFQLQGHLRRKTHAG